MRYLPEIDQEFLDELSKKAIDDYHVQLLLVVTAENECALHEKREITQPPADVHPCDGSFMERRKLM